ncbi:MAG: GvpL/GvpF family gas vesicle protein [Bacteroidetes bacterium]|nr:GvpL/GvpF family gas vesicle protein [Bacteroidota bacterium]
MIDIENEGKYIYCIIASEFSREFDISGIGERGDTVYSICTNGIAAVVSTAPLKKYKTSRENLMTHEKVIEEVMRNHTTLPVRFATVAKHEDRVREILCKDTAQFKDLLAKFDNKKEYGLKVIFREDVIYNHILEKYEELKKLKKIILTLPSEKSHYQRMKIGEMVESALKKEVELLRDEILKILSPLAVEVKMNSTFWEVMVINAAFLVENDHLEDFDCKIEDINTKYGELVRIKYVTVVPPFNFVNLRIQV